jgi:hypothetical protein
MLVRLVNQAPASERNTINPEPGSRKNAGEG